MPGSGFHPIADHIIADAERIEQEKQGKALTPQEAQSLRAAEFLRKIAPYAFTPPKK